MAEFKAQKWPARSLPDEDSSDDEPPPVVIDPSLVSPLAMLRSGVKVVRQRTHADPSQPMLSPPGQAVDFTFDECKGHSAPLGVKFAPFPAVARYCYKFVHPDWLQPLASAFFDKDQIYDRTWEL